jgi:hypothetical protein
MTDEASTTIAGFPWDGKGGISRGVQRCLALAGGRLKADAHSSAPRDRGAESIFMVPLQGGDAYARR